MNYIGKIGQVFGNLKGLYSGINGATLTGAIDVVVVEQEDGTYKCSPFHVRFGKLGVLRSREKVVDIEVNGYPAPIRMKLGDSGEAFFVEELDVFDELFDENLATSPIPQSSPQHSDNDNTSRRNQRRGTQESDDLNLDMIKNVNINVPLGDEELGALAFVDESTASSELTKSDDPKSRKKRRKKRTRNHGSRSDITVSAPPGAQERDDAIFRMDEDLPFAEVSEALNSLDLSVHGTSMAHSRSFHRDFYSDTEVDATSTPQNSRPSTPIQSDSEYEINKIPKEGDDEDVSKWPWGELPSPGHGNTGPASTPLAPPPSQQTAVVNSPGKSSSDENPLSSDDESRLRSGSTNRSMLAGMFSFMKRNPQGTTGNNALDSSPGIYLDDLNLDSMDPEKFALYFPNVGRDREYSRPEHDEDVESGKGSSLPQSPQPGSSPRGSQLNVYIDDRQRQRQNSGGDSINFEAISLCGANLGLFEQSELTYDQLAENPDLFLTASPESIVVKIEGKFVPWPAALPQLLSTTFFKRSLPNHVYQKLIDRYMKKEDQPLDLSPTGANANNTTAIKEAGGTKRQGSFWGFSWRRSQAQGSSAAPLGESSPESVKEEENNEAREQRKNTLKEAPARSGTGTSSSDESEGGGGLEENKSGRNSRKDMHTVINIPTLPVPTPTGIEKFKKTLRLNTEQIRALGLKYGQNEAVFSVTTAYQGTSVARCHIYLWKYDDRVVVSDIDGTITKSDVLGHILPIVGTDWSQSGVAQLFTQIQDNGYKMLYLSSRAIGQAGITRDYLRSIKQDDVTLPDGPLLLNPTSLMSAFHREVIERKPEEFKIACLKDIQLLFPKNPFYAGYGNRINDVWAYRAVDIAIPRIFTINHRGELRHALTNTFQSSYTSLVELAEHIFPVYKDPRTQSHCQTDGFSAFEFWREPLPNVPALGLVISDQISSGPPARNPIS